MPRRRYKLFMVCAVIIVFMLYRVSLNSEWDPYTSLSPKHPHHDPPKSPVKDAGGSDTKSEKKPVKQPEKKPEPTPQDADEPADKVYTPKIPELKTDLEEAGSFGFKTPTKPIKILATPTVGATSAANGSPGAKTVVTTTPAAVKDKKPSGGDDKEMSTVGDDAEPTPTTPELVHWTKVPEHFPVGEETLITLPIGKPKVMPKIQFAFAQESSAAKEKREKRQAAVKAEMQRAWKGYREHAWMHDELRPVSKKSRDPFCGWAASLVDALDTLWIMGMKDEFDEAAKAVKNIDFTYSSTRKEIPVFETVIRYLGGLVAAYDVSGGKDGDYPMLLEKALELADILMGIFDTPNRMPILYYHWEPQYTSQPHRAIGVSVAELGTLSMEFTRLAQLTGKQKFYDAIARITNELEDLQRRTNIPGIFPEQLDASGCNRTALKLLSEERSAAAAEQAAAFEKIRADEEKEAEAARKAAEVYDPVRKQREKEEQKEKDEAWAKLMKGGNPPLTESDDGSTKGQTPDETELRRGNSSAPAGGRAIQRRGTDPEDTGSMRLQRRFGGPFDPDGQSLEWECPAQVLMPGGYGIENYGMGGSQDSTYEYFPKVSPPPAR